MRWFRDTLFLRLFLLMWVALVVSHVVAFGVVTSGLFTLPDRPPWSGPGAPGPRPMPAFPGLPPTPGLPGEAGRDASGILPLALVPRGTPNLPVPLLALDYLVRLVVIGVAAALGARWLASPVRRLVEASAQLSPSLGTDAVLPSLSEHSGTVEVREAARVFNRMARELDAQFKARGLLMASLSHDLKTPLTRMRMRLEAAEPELALVQRCIADIREMNLLVETALDVFRHAGADEPVQALDLHSLLQSMADDLIEAGQSISVSGSAGAVLARPVALRRVVANLLENAVRYGERARVSLRDEADTVKVTIDDAGPGIAPELLERVFQPFFRVEASRNRNSGGSGLGLYIARDLLRRQGGDVVLANRPSGGLRAEFSLPRARGA